MNVAALIIQREIRNCEFLNVLGYPGAGKMNPDKQNYYLVDKKTYPFYKKRISDGVTKQSGRVKMLSGERSTLKN
jgi:hypothetical protein